MSGSSLSAPKIGEEGLPLILVSLAVTGAAVAAILWWGSKNAKTDPQKTGT